MLFRSTNWSSLSAGIELHRPISSSQFAFGVSFALSRSGTPYFVFKDGNISGKVRLISFNGYDWVYSGPPQYGNEQYVTDESYTSYTAITVAGDGTPYLAQSAVLGPFYYNDLYYFNRQVRVKKLSENVVIGNRSLCVGGKTYLEPDRHVSGSWSSSNTAIATVGTSGIVSGIGAGTAIISYNNGGCPTTAIVTVNSSVSAGTLSGASSVIAGSSISLSSTVSGGIWSSSSAAIATVGSSSGSVAGVAPGTAIITYAVTGACGLAVAMHTVNVTASRPAITGEGQGVVDIYPNPTSGDVHLYTSSAGKVSVCSIDGREIATYNAGGGTTIIKLPVGITAGVYLFCFKGEDGSAQTTRLIYQP